MVSSIKNKDVAETFTDYPMEFREKLLILREIILKVAKNTPQIGELIETLKWGEPSYLPEEKNIGTTVRIHWLKTKPDQYGIYFNCQTNLIEQFKKRYGNKFSYEGKRALIFKIDDELNLKNISDCVSIALTYHLNKK